MLTRPSARKSPSREAVRLAGAPGTMDLGGWDEWPASGTVAQLANQFLTSMYGVKTTILARQLASLVNICLNHPGRGLDMQHRFRQTLSESLDRRSHPGTPMLPTSKIR